MSALSIDFTAFPAYTVLAPNERQPWLDHVASFPAEFLVKPADGDEFTNPEHCLLRLNAWGFLSGAFYVSLRSAGGRTPSWDFACKFHSDKTLNRRALEPEVIKDDKGNIISKRKRNTLNKRLGCPVYFHLSHVLQHRGSQGRVYKGRWAQEEHNHPIPLNPLAIKAHREVLQSYQELTIEARKLRFASQSYSNSQVILRQGGFPLQLTAKEYYNTVRNQPFNKDDVRTIKGLEIALKEAGFEHHIRTGEPTLDPTGNPLRQLIQIIFWPQRAVSYAQRFIADHLLLLDATFNTNRHRMPLIVASGITPEGKTFPIALSFCPAEDQASFSFFLKTMSERIFTNNVIGPAVILSDQASGLISAIDNQNILPDTALQLCTWHAVSSMLSRFKKSKYTIAEIDGNPEEGIKGIRKLAWDYISSINLKELATNRQSFLNKLHDIDKAYILDTWGPKENRVVLAFTRQQRNLGCNATQRSESFHRVFKKVTNGQLTLQQSAEQCMHRMLEVYNELDKDENSARMNHETALNRRTFEFLIGTVSLEAIKRMKEEWNTLSNLLTTAQSLSNCDCDLRHRFSLPCRHFLHWYYLNDLPIPRSAVHKRWWINGPLITLSERDWQPATIRPFIQGEFRPPQPRVFRALEDVLDLRNRLEVSEQTRFDQQILSVTQNLISVGSNHQILAAIPIGVPSDCPRSSFHSRKAKTGRVLTALEAAKRQEQQDQRKEAQRQRDKAIEIERREENSASAAVTTMTTITLSDMAPATTRLVPESPILVPASPPTCPSPSPPFETPPKAPLWPISTGDKEPSPDPVIDLPSSTAPAILGRGHRDRKHSKRQQEAVATLEWQETRRNKRTRVEQS
jgi:hypothetical protein